MKYLVVSGAVLAVCCSSFAIAGKPYGQHLCNDPGYHCIKVKRGQTWKSLFPDPREREIVRDLNRTNMKLHYRNKIVVPDDLSSISALDLAPFPHHIDPPGERLIEVDLKELAFAAYAPEGELLHWGPISGGKAWCKDVNRACKTIKGEFRVYSERGKYCVSNTFPVDVIGGGAPMPYCMFFKGGYAMHASTVVPGYHASHGCIRMSYEDARWLSKHFVTTKGEKGGTKVIVR